MKTKRVPDKEPHSRTVCIAGKCWNCGAEKENVYGVCTKCGQFGRIPTRNEDRND